MSQHKNPFVMQPSRTFHHIGLVELVVTPFINPLMDKPPAASNANFDHSDLEFGALEPGILKPGTLECGALAPLSENVSPLHVCVIRFEKWEQEDSWLTSFPAALSGLVIGTTDEYIGDHPEIARLMLSAIKAIEFVHRKSTPVSLYVVLANPELTLCRHLTQAAMGRLVIVIEAPQIQTALTVAGQVRICSQAITASAQNPKQTGMDVQWAALAGLLGPLYVDGTAHVGLSDFQYALGLRDVHATRTGGIEQLQNLSINALVSEFDALLASVAARTPCSASTDQLGDQPFAEIESGKVAVPALTLKLWFHYCPGSGGASNVNYLRLCAIAEKYDVNQISSCRAQRSFDNKHRLDLVWTCAADIEA